MNLDDVGLGFLLLGTFSLGVSVSMFALGLWIKHTPDYIIIKAKKL